MGQSDLVRLYSMGCHSVTGACKKAVLPAADTCPLHDLCLYNVYLYSARRFRPVASGILRQRGSWCGDSPGMARAREEKTTRLKTLNPTKKLKKSTGLTVALLIYVSATAAYFLPRYTEISNTEKYVTVIASYVIVLALWLVLRKKEELQRKRREEDKIERK